jgi:hypothetical protein
MACPPFPGLNALAWSKSLGRIAIVAQLPRGATALRAGLLCDRINEGLGMTQLVSGVVLRKPKFEDRFKRFFATPLLAYRP